MSESHSTTPLRGGAGHTARRPVAFPLLASALVTRGLLAGCGGSKRTSPPPPDVLAEPDGSLLMSAYGMSTTDPGPSLGSIGLWRSR